MLILKYWEGISSFEIFAYYFLIYSLFPSSTDTLLPFLLCHSMLVILYNSCLFCTAKMSFGNLQYEHATSLSPLPFHDGHFVQFLSFSAWQKWHFEASGKCRCEARNELELTCGAHGQAWLKDSFLVRLRNPTDFSNKITTRLSE